MSSPQHKRATVYQIDFTAVLSGKRIASSKRRIRWRFGFANPEAISAGETGTACRGEEHDITFVWSISSGKRIVLADGQEVHFSSSRSNTFDYSWTMRGNHVLKVIAHANPPMLATPGFKQYDFFVDGMSFFSFPKLFRLGLAPGDPRASQGIPHTQLAESSRRFKTSTDGIASIEAPHNPDEEELYLQEAIRQSLNDTGEKSESRAVTGNVAPPAEVDLLDFGGPAAPAPPASTSNPYGPPAASSDSWGGSYSSYPNNDLTASAQLPPASNTAASLTSYDGAFGSNTMSNTFGGSASASGSNLFATGDPSSGALVPAASSGVYGYGPPPPSSNPYAQPAASNANPYGPPTASSSNPYGPPITTPTASSSNPYGPPTATPSASSSNPYGPPSAASSMPYSVPVASQSDPFSVPAAATSNPYASSTSSNSFPANPYGAAAPGGNQFGAPATGAFVAPAPISTNLYGPQNTFGDTAIPPNVTPRQQQTPSTLGFGSPPADFSFSPEPKQYTGSDMQNGYEPEPQVSNPTFTMNSLEGSAASTNLGGLDQAFSKLVNLDTFSVASKKDEKRSNPFENKANSTIDGSRSLADIQKSKPPPRNDVMRTPAPPPGAMVVSSNPSGSYASQYGIQQSQPDYGGMQYGQPPQQFAGGMQPPQYGAQMQQRAYGAEMIQPQYGMASTQAPGTMQNQQSAFGQQPPMQQQAPYGQQPPMQQQAPYGQQPPMQQQAPYGQPPASYGQQQPQYGGVPQQVPYGQPQQTFY